jgi:2-keto-4-pentenoate hydratase/2-oxohepta-3-ene-1,7-dioic acid hydratase in catechol pathway
VEPEAELAVVVGRTAKNLTLGNARSVVLGYTIGNDVTARELQKSDELWLSAKSQDTFTPAGPWIVTGLDHADLAVGVVLNGTPNCGPPAPLTSAGRWTRSSCT